MKHLLTTHVYNLMIVFFDLFVFPLILNLVPFMFYPQFLFLIGISILFVCFVCFHHLLLREKGTPPFFVFLCLFKENENKFGCTSS